MKPFLDWCKNNNNENNGKYFHEQRKSSSIFFLSVDGMLGKEALVVLVNLSRIMAVKTEETIFHIRGWTNCGSAVAAMRL